jgi:hypothetical protein
VTDSQLCPGRRNAAARRDGSVVRPDRARSLEVSLLEAGRSRDLNQGTGPGPARARLEARNVTVIATPNDQETDMPCITVEPRTTLRSQGTR